MSCLRVIDGSWVVDYRQYGRRHRVTIGRVSAIAEDEAKRELARIASVMRQANASAAAWATARTLPATDKAVSEDGIRVARRRASTLLKNATKNAARRGIAFHLTAADVAGMIEESRGRCCVSGIPFTLEGKTGFRHPFAPSIDRIDSGKDYSPDNCCLVCVAVNVALNEWGYRVLEKIAMGMSSHVPPWRIISTS